MPITNQYDKEISLSTSQLNQAYNSNVTALNSSLYNLSQQQQQQSSGGGAGWGILNNVLTAATQAANIYTGVKTQSPVVQTIAPAGTQPQGQTMVYQTPAPPEKNNTGLIIGIIVGVLVLAIILILVFRGKKEGGK